MKKTSDAERRASLVFALQVGLQSIPPAAAHKNPMTIETILAELAAKHGNDWPRHALAELIIDAIEVAANDDQAEHADAYARYLLLHQWTLDTLHAGIAFRQTSAL